MTSPYGAVNTPAATQATVPAGYQYQPSFVGPVYQPSNGSSGPTINPLSLPKPSFLSSTGLNTFGESLGFGVPAPSATIAGPVQATSANAGALTTTPLSGVLTGAGVGGLVGMVNPLARGSTTGQLGGALGGAAAAALGFTGPIGMVAGGFIGSSIGGLFGKKKPGVHLSEFQTGVWTGNDFNGGTGYTNKRADQSQAQAVHTDFTKYLNYLNQQYGYDFSGTAFRGGYNDRDRNGWFLGVKTNNKGGDPDVDPNAWDHFSFDPNSPDKYQTYAKIAAGMLAAKGQLTPEALQQINADLQTKQNTALLGGAGSGNAPMVEKAKPSNKESFTDFLNRYRSGNLDSGPVTAQRTIEPKPDMSNPLVKTMIQPTEKVAMSGNSLVPQGVTPVQGQKLTPGTEAYNKLPDIVKVSM